MDNTHADGNLPSEMVDELDDCIDKKTWVNEAVIGIRFINEKPCDTDNKQGNIRNYSGIKDENIDNPALVVGETKLLTDCTDNEMCVNETIMNGGYIKQEPCDTKDGSIQNHQGIKDENIDDLTVLAQDFELGTDCIDNKVCIYKTIISGAYIKEEPCDTIDESGSRTHNNVALKACEECGQKYDLYCLKCSTLHRIFNSNNPDGREDTVRQTLPKNFIDICETQSLNKLCLNESISSEGYINQNLCIVENAQETNDKYLSVKDENINDLTVVAQETELITDDIDNKICVYETIISGGYIKQEPCDTENKSGSIHNNVDMKDCEECSEEYDLYCLKCPMLIRIFDSNNPDGKDNAVRRTLPKNFIDICENQSGVGIVALRIIPKGVVFGPFRGLDSIKDDPASKWKLKNNELVYTNDPGWLNWMQYVRMADQSSCQNLVPFQYEGGLYYRSECHINVGDELLVRWDSDCKSEIQDMEDGYWEPLVCERLDDSYACTFCCVGYKSISHLKAHNSICIEKRNRKDFCKEIIQCDICKIYLDKKEYADYHMDRCYKSNGKCVPDSRCGRNRRKHNGKRPFSCTHCPYKATTKSFLKQHIAIHNDDKPFACTFCSYKTTRKSGLKQHMAVHNDDRPFACKICSYKTTTNSKLKQHVAVHNDDKPLACPLCSYKTTTNWQLKHHLAIHNGDKPFACTLCPYKTTKKSILKRHIVVHNEDRPFTCPFCSYKTNTNLTLKRHILTHNDDRPFACTVCPYKAKTKPVLKHHIATHCDDRPFACALCPYKAKTKSFLRQHIAQHKGDKPFACTLCPYKTMRKSFLKLHMAVHNGDRPFPCSLCPYKATTNSKLKQHVALHNADKAFACTLCPYKTTTSSQLKQHVAIHNDDKAFACTLCPYKTTRKSILKQHMVVHSDDRPFGCSLCSYKANTKSSLKRHIITHSEDRPFACTFCPYKATTSSNLKRHVASHNK